MMNHTKRRRDKYNPYFISERDGRYYLTWQVEHQLEIDRTLYELFDAFELEDVSHINAMKRHIDKMPLSELLSHDRALREQTPVEEAVMKNELVELLHKLIDTLPEKQRCRLLLYYFEDLTYEQIAALEGRTKMAIKFSIDHAIGRRKGRHPTHCEIPAQQGLVCDSFAMLEQIYTLDKSKLTDFLGSLDNDIMRRIDKALAKSLGLRKRDFIDNDAERGIECECDREKTASFNTG